MEEEIEVSISKELSIFLVFPLTTEIVRSEMV